MKSKIEHLIEIANQSEIPVIRTAQGRGKSSFGIINSKGNGKRISISKTLAEELKLEHHASLLVAPAKGVIMLSEKVLSDRAYNVTLKGDGSKTCYCAGLVRGLTEVFKLDFSEHVSLSFPDISIEEYEGGPVAVIDMTTHSSVQTNLQQPEEGVSR